MIQPVPFLPFGVMLIGVLLLFGGVSYVMGGWRQLAVMGILLVLISVAIVATAVIATKLGIGPPW